MVENSARSIAPKSRLVSSTWGTVVELMAFLAERAAGMMIVEGDCARTHARTTACGVVPWASAMGLNTV